VQGAVPPLERGSAVVALRHRILQADGRRYSINIEESYWAILERLAQRRGIRVSKLVHGIAPTDDGISLASTLRLFCLRETMAELEHLERRMAEHKRSSGPNYVQSIVDANPSPSLLLGHDGAIQRLNAAFARWSRTPPAKLIGQSYEWFFQLRTARPMKEIKAEFAGGSRSVFSSRISYIAPGRVVVANASLCLAASAGPGEYSWCVLIDSVPPPAGPPEKPKAGG
jgi:predicted DNA-binding ribbon-helix-helix protein